MTDPYQGAEAPACNCLGCQAHAKFMTWEYLLYERAKEIEKLQAATGIHHDEGTMFKVMDAIRSATGFNVEDAQQVILRIQNAGILFRELKSDVHN